MSWIAVVNGGADATAAPSDNEKDLGDLIVEGANLVPGLVKGAAVLLVAILICIALLMLAIAMVRRARRASLVVRPFLDEAVGVKVGAGIASLVEERLVGALRREDLAEDGYDLDRVAIDIELLAEDNDLTKAMERLADVPQLKLVVAVMDLIERLLPSRGLAAAGELLPAGRDGAGVSLALFKGNRLTSRSVLWERKVNLWLQSEDKNTKPRKPKDASGADGAEPSSHYDLAAPAAWWIQYEAARILDRNVSLITSSASSFSLVGIGLGYERQDLVESAEEAYANALARDPNNVAALFNLSQLLARRHCMHRPAALLLVHAKEALADRNTAWRPGIPVEAENQLQDPTWYRVRYALAVRCLQIALARDKGGKANEFGSETKALLGGLQKDEKRMQSSLGDPGETAVAHAGELLVKVVSALADAGWNWVGRKPPRYISWRRRLLSWPGRLLSGARRRTTRRRKDQPVTSDEKLARFLGHVVEPAAAILYCSALLVRGDEGHYCRLRAAVLDPAGGERRPLDRRALGKIGAEQWALKYLSAFLSEQPSDPSPQARAAAGLERTRYGAPIDPAPRARYSLACLLSLLATTAKGRGDEVAQRSFVSGAAAQLERALSGSPSGRRERLAGWARLDPDLRGLRKYDEKAFETIVARWGPAERRPVTRTKLDSSAVSSAAYLDDEKVLELEFADGSRYQYFDVPEGIYDQLVEAKSAGSFFSEKIAPEFAFIRA